MPNPRPARPIRREGMCRSNLRRQRNKAWLSARLVEKLLEVADLIERKRAEHHDAKSDLIHEKAPDLSTGGFNDLVIPAQEPRPPRMRRLD